MVPRHDGRDAARRAAGRPDVVLHTEGAVVLAPPSETPDGWVHWRVAPALTGYVRHRSGPIVAAMAAAAAEVNETTDSP